ncbi:MAG TPA: LysR family transcriptional regulator [Hyphomicrobiales bacterium]|nr:LysR family transcriptional regulator [Hyphomicrobiales bacterium]
METLPSLWQLRVFETVARLENVSRASRELLRSQPAVTSSVGNLEEMLGVTLFERSTTGTYPTDAGIAFLVRARRILSAVAQALTEVCGTPAATAANVASAITRTQMRCLIAIAESRSFSEAARVIGIAEASLQRAARQLERNIGCQLYKSTVSGVTTTAIGSEFAKRMALVASQIEAARDDMVRYNHPKERSVVVGVLLLDPTILLTSAIRDLTEKYPDVRTTVVSGSYETLLKRLNAGSIDFMIGLLKRPDYAESIVEEPLYRDRYCVVARRHHPLARVRAVTLDQLRRYDWILPQRGSPRRLAFEHIFSDGAPPAASIETYSLSTIRVTLIESDMLTVLSLTEVLCEQRVGILTGLGFAVPGEGPVVGITMRKDWKPNDVQSVFLEAIKRTSRELRAVHGFAGVGARAAPEREDEGTAAAGPALVAAP